MENLGTVVKRGKILKSYRILETSPASNLLCLLPEPPPSRREDKVKLWFKTNFFSSPLISLSYTKPCSKLRYREGEKLDIRGFHM